MSQRGRVMDRATLYLCRQGPEWVVVIESAQITGAVRFHHAGGDTYEARSELLSSARRACPDAVIMSADGAMMSADFEWRLDVLAIEARPGDLGAALHRALFVTFTHVASGARESGRRRCDRGLHPSFTGRPRTF